MLPPNNFGMVDWGIYRSAYPTEENFAFLKTLHLKSIIYLCKEPYLHAEFVRENGIKVFQFGLEGKCGEIDDSVIQEALEVMLDSTNYPLLVHCNRGKHRTGCLVGSYRKIKGWSLASVYAEYDRYAGAKARERDKRFLQHFNASTIQPKLRIWKAISWWLRAFFQGHLIQQLIAMYAQQQIFVKDRKAAIQ